MKNIVEVVLYGKYGNQLGIPVNETARLICKLLGRKSLSKKTMEIVKELGFEIVIKNNVDTGK